MSFSSKYPPVPGRTINQDLLWEAGADIAISQYLTITYPPAFVARYGTPVSWYRGFERLMNIPIRKEIKLKIKQPFIEFASTKQYLEYCQLIDVTTAEKGVAPADREEMDGAWTQMLILLFDRSRLHMEKYVGYQHTYNSCLESVEEVEYYMKSLLMRAFSWRFDTNGSDIVEKYWTEKGEKFTGMNVACIDDNFVEHQFNPPRDITLEADYPDREGYRAGVSDVVKGVIDDMMDDVADMQLNESDHNNDDDDDDDDWDREREQDFLFPDDDSDEEGIMDIII